MNYAQTILDFLKVRYFGRKVPIFLTISLTDRCNFRCKYCDVYERRTKEMSTSEVKVCIDEFYEMGAKKVGFCGGEPTLRKDLKELIDHAKSKGMFTTLTSNGFLVPRKINDIKNLDILILSLDGPKNVHDNLRRKGSYEKVIESLKLCKENGIRVWTITVLTSQSVKHVDFVLNLAEKMDFHTIFQPVYKYLLYKGSLSGLSPTKESFTSAIDKVISAKKEGAKIASSFDYLKSISYWPEIKRYAKCWAGKSYCYVDTNGKVYPCIDLIDKISSKNGVDVGFKEAFKSMPEINCTGCWINCYLENDLITALKPRSILNAIRKV